MHAFKSGAWLRAGPVGGQFRAKNAACSYAHMYASMQMRRETAGGGVNGSLGHVQGAQTPVRPWKVSDALTQHKHPEGSLWPLSACHSAVSLQQAQRTSVQAGQLGGREGHPSRPWHCRSAPHRAWHEHGPRRTRKATFEDPACLMHLSSNKQDRDQSKIRSRRETQWKDIMQP